MVSSPRRTVQDGIRRHLNASQRACVAVKLMPELKAEAKKRKARKSEITQSTVDREKIPEQTEDGRSRDHGLQLPKVKVTR